jgi:hypothetical protein
MGNDIRPERLFTSQNKLARIGDDERAKLTTNGTISWWVTSRNAPQTMTSAGGREMIDILCGTCGVPIRKACRAIPACRTTYQYRSRRPEQVPLTKRIREIAETLVRADYGRINPDPQGIHSRAGKLILRNPDVAAGGASEQHGTDAFLFGT